MQTRSEAVTPVAENEQADERRLTCVSCQGSVDALSRCSQCGAAVRVQQYRVETLIAQHGHSRMYRARDASGRVVALKELMFALVPSVEQLEAFEREARVLKQLDHPQTPALIANFSVGEGVNTRLYLVQQFVEGDTLGQRISKRALTEAEARDVAVQALTVLQALHGRTPKLLHRDIKPGNIIIEPSGRVMLVDFGSARDLQNSVTHGSTLVGTFGYMAPEQLGGTVDETSDLFGLGATLLHAVTGVTPDQQMLHDDEPEVFRTLQVSPLFKQFLQRLTQRRRAQRFASATAALEFLNAGVTRRPVPRAVIIAAVGVAAVTALLIVKYAFPSQWTEYELLVGGRISEWMVQAFLGND